MIKRIYLLMVMSILILGIWMVFGSEDNSPRISTEADLDGDGQLEVYLLQDHRLTITEGQRCLWQSDKKWSVNSFALGDVNNDGIRDLAISLWKTGSFGSFKPFWHEGEDNSYKNHLFLYKLEDKAFRPVWCSSDLDHPIVSIDICDANNDGIYELKVIEGKYRKRGKEQYALDMSAPVQTTIWQWKEWGFCFLK